MIDMAHKLPVRISSEFAAYPMRILAQNAPIIWSDGKDFKIHLKQQDINISLAKELLTHQAPVIYADDLVNLVKIEGGNVLDIYGMKIVPTAVPPFDNMFVEVNMLPIVNEMERASKDIMSIAGYVVSNPFDKEQADIIRSLLMIHATMGNITEKVNAAENIDIVLEKLKNTIKVPKVIFRSGHIDEETIPVISSGRFVAVYPYAVGFSKTTGESRKKEICIGPIGMIIYMVDTESGLLKTKDGQPWYIWLNPLDSDEETYLLDANENFYRDIAETAFAMSIRVIAMLNCSNVQMVNQGMTTDGLSKKDIKIRKLKSLRYHELRVKVGKEIVPIYGKKGNTGEKGLSMVRGHFKDYSQGKGLFGRIKKPNVWVPPHARGDARNGVIMKDYNLVAGEKDI